MRWDSCKQSEPRHTKAGLMMSLDFHTKKRLGGWDHLVWNSIDKYILDLFYQEVAHLELLDAWHLSYLVLFVNK